MYFKFKKLLLPSLIFLLFTIPLYSQVNISVPIEKAVYQRSSSNTANIPISGTYTQDPITTVQAQLKLVSDNSIVLPWTIIDSNPLGGHFQGTLTNITAGWYILEIRTLRSGTQVESSQINNIGIGDVFLIAGQSNAQGIDNVSGLNQTSNRVVTHNFIDSCSNAFPTYPNFSFVNSNTNLGMHGIKGWLYAKLGDNLVTNQGVPVAFFNSGAGGSSVRNWSQSSYGQATLHPFYNANYCMYPTNLPINPNNPTGVGSPYTIFKNSINYYNSIYGIRAVLWHQGESESNVGHSTSYNSYLNSLDSLVQKSRADFNATVPWVISRASYFNGNTNLDVINAQTDYGNRNSLKIFQGPNTDLINAPSQRVDNIHFSTAGLSDAANAWSTALNSNFYSNASPISPQNFPNLSFTINENNLIVTAPNGYSSYKWIRSDLHGDNYSAPAFSTSQNISVTTGRYRCYVIDYFGKFQISQEINVDKYLNTIVNSVSCSGTVYVSDLKPFSKLNGYGPIELDKSNGDLLDGDGQSISIDGLTYPKGIGTNSNSIIEYKIANSNFHTFSAKIGIDDEVGPNGSVIFKVYGNNTLLYTSGIKTGSSPVETINVNITGFNLIKLEVSDAGDGITNDHANWADAKILCDIIAPTSPQNLTSTEKSRKCISINWGASTDNIAVTAYNILVNGNLLATVENNVFNYQITNLNPITNYTIAVEAVDAVGNKSSQTSLVVQTYQFVPFTYSKINFCIAEQVTPVLQTSFNSFKYIAGPGGNLNLTNGHFSTSNTGQHTIRYYFGANTCLDSGTVNIVCRSIPTNTPTISTNKVQIKAGESIILSGIGCGPTFTYKWSYGQKESTLSLSPSDTTNYTLRCNNTGTDKNLEGCLGPVSNTIKINVIPLCSNNLQLISTINDITITGPSPVINSSNTIHASNKILSNTIVNYKAANSIVLDPGFVANSGTSFLATVEGCPN
jgi:hypothetical protein